MVVCVCSLASHGSSRAKAASGILDAVVGSSCRSRTLSFLRVDLRVSIGPSHTCAACQVITHEGPGEGASTEAKHRDSLLGFRHTKAESRQRHVVSLCYALAATACTEHSVTDLGAGRTVEPAAARVGAGCRADERGVR